MWYYVITKDGSYEKIKSFFKKNIDKDSLTLEELSSTISFLREYEKKINVVCLEDFLEEMIYQIIQNPYQGCYITDLQPNGLSNTCVDFSLMTLNKDCYCYDFN